jgi:hypothetical protein
MTLASLRHERHPSLRMDKVELKIFWRFSRDSPVYQRHLGWTSVLRLRYDGCGAIDASGSR